MARKPAWTTRGTISGRPAKATSCPRPVSARAMPRLGGRLPPPDQFNHSIRAMFVPPHQRDGDAANDRLCRLAAEAEIAAQQLPCVDVEGDDQRIMRLAARLALKATQ